MAYGIDVQLNRTPPECEPCSAMMAGTFSAVKQPGNAPYITAGHGRIVPTFQSEKGTTHVRDSRAAGNRPDHLCAWSACRRRTQPVHRQRVALGPVRGCQDG